MDFHMTTPIVNAIDFVSSEKPGMKGNAFFTPGRVVDVW